MLQALLRFGQIRLRPILLTTITTAAGLAPLGFFASGQVKFLAPVAISIIFGLMVSTILTFIIYPLLIRHYRRIAQAVRSFLGLHRDTFIKEIPDQK